MAKPIIIQKITDEFTKILILSKTYQRPIRDPSETNMPERRPIGEIDMPHWRPTCLIGDPLETDMPDKTHQRPIFLI